MSAKHESLAAVFAPTPTNVEGEGRGKKLAGLLPPRRVNAVELPKVVSAAANASQTAATAPSELEVPATHRAVLESTSTAIRNKGVYLPHDLLGSLKVRTRAMNSTYTDMLIDAFDAISDDDLIAKFNPQASPEEQGGGMPRRRRTNDSAKSGTQIQLRLDKSQEAWLTAKEKHVGAPSRSALVSVAYELYFEATPPKKRSH